MQTHLHKHCQSDWAEHLHQERYPTMGESCITRNQASCMIAAFCLLLLPLEHSLHFASHHHASRSCNSQDHGHIHGEYSHLSGHRSTLEEEEHQHLLVSLKSIGHSAHDARRCLLCYVFSQIQKGQWHAFCQVEIAPERHRLEQSDEDRNCIASPLLLKGSPRAPPAG